MFPLNKTRQKTVVFTILCLISIIIGCEGNAKERKSINLEKRENKKFVARRKPDETVIKFGFDPRLNLREQARIYIPLLNYLEKKTGYEFEIRFTKKNEDIINNLGKGVVQFAAIGGVSYVKAHEEYGVVCIVKGLNAQGKAGYQSAIVTWPDNNRINRIEDIYDSSFAFGDKNSTQGHLIPRMMLSEAGISLDNLRKYTYTGSHQKCAETVISKYYASGGMQDTLAKSLEKKGLIKIIAMSDFYPSSGISANKDVDPKIIEAVKKALIEFDPMGNNKGDLYCWEKTEMAGGFIECHDSDYDKIRKPMFRFGFLEKVD